MEDLISRQAALDALGERPVVWSDNDDYTLGARNQYDMDRLALETVPSAQSEQLTDTEQRIFLAAMSREEKVCKKVDEEWVSGDEEREISLVHICHEIIRKVKGALWTT